MSDGDEDGDNRLYENWLETRWKASAAMQAMESKSSIVSMNTVGAAGAAVGGDTDGGWVQDGAQGAFVCCEVAEEDRAKVMCLCLCLCLCRDPVLASALVSMTLQSLVHGQYVPA